MAEITEALPLFPVTLCTGHMTGRNAWGNQNPELPNPKHLGYLSVPSTPTPVSDTEQSEVGKVETQSCLEILLCL